MIIDQNGNISIDHNGSDGVSTTQNLPNVIQGGESSSSSGNGGTNVSSDDHSDDNSVSSSNNGESINVNGGKAVVNGHTLSDGVNTIDGQTYTLTKSYLLGPSITHGPGMQINPRVTQAFGCQLVADRVSQGNCDGIQSKIDAALASVTSSAPPAQSTGSGGDTVSSSNSNSGSGSADAAVHGAQRSQWAMMGAVAVGGVLAALM